MINIQMRFDFFKNFFKNNYSIDFNLFNNSSNIGFAISQCSFQFSESISIIISYI